MKRGVLVVIILAACVMGVAADQIEQDSLMSFITTNPFLKEILPQQKGSTIVHPFIEPPQPIEYIIINQETFSPDFLKIKTGTKVVWVNEYDRPHVLRDFNATFVSEKILHGDHFEHTFENPGTYYYRDIIYNWRGTIQVE